MISMSFDTNSVEFTSIFSPFVVGVGCTIIKKGLASWLLRMKHINKDDYSPVGNLEVIMDQLILFFIFNSFAPKQDSVKHNQRAQGPQHFAETGDAENKNRVIDISQAARILKDSFH